MNFLCDAELLFPALMPIMYIEELYVDYVPAFEDLGLGEELLRGVYSCGLERPGPVQGRVILPVLSNRDVLCIAPRGTDRETATSICAVSRIDSSVRGWQVLVLSPLPKVAARLKWICDKLGDFAHIVTYMLAGDENTQHDLRIMDSGVQVVFSTPGSLLSLLAFSSYRLDAVETMIITDFAEVLECESWGTLENMIGEMEAKPQVAIFSDKVDVEVRKNLLRNAVKITVKEEDRTLEGIKQFYVSVQKAEWKSEIVIDLLANIDFEQVVVYCNSQIAVRELAAALENSDFSVLQILDEIDRCDGSRVLITTDAMADKVRSVAFTLHFDMPVDYETYLRRIGVSGCFGKRSLSIAFVLYGEVEFLRALEKFFNTEISELPANLSNL